MVRVRRWLLPVVALVLGACHASTEDQARKVWSAYCDRTRDCAYSSFIAVFASQDQCIQKGLDGLPEGSGSDQGCPDDELSRCLDSIRGAPCSPLGPLDVERPDGGPLDPRALPDPCSRCSPSGPALLDSLPDAGP
jgi:hypothetical protein